MSANEQVFDTRIYEGAVSHRRIRPVSHRFVYRVFSFLINIDELPALDKAHRWFAFNRTGLFSFHEKDHGPKDGSPLRPWIAEQLKTAELDFPLGTVRLLCFPRIFGLVFNPLSVWYCYDTSQKLRAVLYEVRNTVGEWRGYLLPVDANRAEGTLIRQACDKAFYVSPLMTMNCRYNFTLNEPDDQMTIAIRETEEGNRTLMAAQTGKRRTFSDKTLRNLFLRHPLMFVKVVGGIHWEAFRLMAKGLKYYANPGKKTGDVTAPALSEVKQPAE
jgi:hypothetical protein